MLEGKKPLRIYVAGPYTGETEVDTEWNVKRATNLGVILYMRGHYPLIPHLTHYVALAAINRHPVLTWSDYMRCDLSWLSVSEAMFFFGRSAGADMEHEQALKMGIPIYYTLDEVPYIPDKYRTVIELDKASKDRYYRSG